MTTNFCACGRPLHYSNPETLAYVSKMVLLFGENVLVTVPSESYLIPRHYIALHGLKAADVPKLAEKYGWPKCGFK